MLVGNTQVWLQGKYRDLTAVPQEARLVKYKGRYAEAEQRYGPKSNVREAVAAYCRLAEQAGMLPYELAIRWEFSPRPLHNEASSLVSFEHNVAFPAADFLTISCLKFYPSKLPG